MSDASAAFEIRSAELIDVRPIARIAERAYAHYVSRMGQEPAPMRDDFETLTRDRCVFVLGTDSRIAGYCVLIDAADHLHLSNVAVDPSWQGHGLGKRLVAFAEDEAIRRNLGRIELYTNVHMTENQQLYPALGYTEFDRREEHGFFRIYYRKRLDT